MTTVTVTVHRKAGNIIIEMADTDNINEVLEEHGIMNHENITISRDNALEESGFSFETGV